MSLRRALALGILLPGCATSMRAGPRATVSHADPTVQGEGTFAFGGSSSPGPGMLGFPITFAAGARARDGRAMTLIETGIEAAEAFQPDSRWGYRVGGRFGGQLAGPDGTYLGARGGLMLALEPRGFDRPITTLTLEALANVDSRTAAPTLGGVLSIGWDTYGTFRIPSGRRLRGAVTLGAPRARWAAAIDLDVVGLSDAARARLGNEWLRDAHLEHASIAAFAKVALELLARGAPADLVERAHRAAIDETRHAEICFGVARAYLGVAVDPPALEVRGGGGDLARDSLLDGAIGEGLAAALLRARARRAKDPVLRRLLNAMARDEARHAELAWDIVAWCGEDLRDVLLEQPLVVDAREPTRELRDHGMLDHRAIRRLQKQVTSFARARLAAGDSIGLQWP